MITGTIKSVEHRNPTINPLTSNGMLVGDIVIETDDGREVSVSVPLESVTKAGKQISVYQGNQGEWLVSKIEGLTTVEIFPWLGDDFDRELGKFVDENGIPLR